MTEQNLKVLLSFLLSKLRSFAPISRLSNKLPGALLGFQSTGSVIADTVMKLTIFAGFI